MKHMLYGTTAFNQPLAFDTAKVTTVRENIYYLEFNRNEWGTRFWLSISHPTCVIRWKPCLHLHRPSINHWLLMLLRLQMWECICLLEPNLNERPDSDFPFPTQLIIRCGACFMAQQPSIRTCVILEDLYDRWHIWGLRQMKYLGPLDAVTKISLQVKLDRGVLLQHVRHLRFRSPQMPNLELQSRRIFSKDALMTWLAKPVPTMVASQWVVWLIVFPHSLVPHLYL